MTIENQVCTLEQAKRLKELGVNAPSLFVFVTTNNQKDGFFSHIFPAKEGERKYNEWSQWTIYCNSVEIYPAYTVAELGELLPMYCDSCKTHTGWDCVYKTRPDGLIHMEGCHSTEAKARAAMLIFLLENNLHTIK